MIGYPQSDGEPTRPPPAPEIPPSGGEILAEVERLRREPLRLRCLGMSLTTVIILTLILLGLWRLLH